MKYEDCKDETEVKRLFNRNSTKISEAHKDGVLSIDDANELYDNEKKQRDLTILKVNAKG